MSTGCMREGSWGDKGCSGCSAASVGSALLTVGYPGTASNLSVPRDVKTTAVCGVLPALGPPQWGREGLGEAGLTLCCSLRLRGWETPSHCCNPEHCCRA